MQFLFPSQHNNHVTPLPTGYKFAMASVMDDAKKKGQDAKFKAEDLAHDAKLKAENMGHDVKLKAEEAKVKVGGGSPFGKIELYSPKYYLACTLGGIVACGVTHALVTPLDLVKCRRQVDPQLYKGNIEGFSKIFRAEGLRGNFTGWGPTLVGYSFQGAGKYGLYEVFKKKYADIVGEETAHKYRTTLYLTASASAEFFADVLLCPWEAIKVRMQTTIPPFARGTLEGWNKITSTEGMAGLYKGLQPLWGRQIPYTMMKFASFERVVEYIYSTLPKPKHEYGKLVQTEVSFVGGYIAGIFCAVISHPADVMVSKLNSERQAGESAGAAMSRIYSRIGFAGLWNGLPVRIVMVGTLTGLQWLIYDSFKLYCGLPTTGGAKK